MTSTSALAAGQKTYSEQEFLSAFSGKSSDAVAKVLGAPARKEQSIKPTNADEVLADKDIGTSKPDNIEMWYYNKRVTYAPNKTFTLTELTFANGKCVNITFFNQ